MTKNYTGDRVTQEKLYTINPNPREAFLRDILTIFIVLIVLTTITIIFKFTVGLESFAQILDMFGITITWLGFTKYFTGLLTLVMIGLALYEFAVTGDLKYEVHTDKLVIQHHQYYVLLTETDIPYENIAKITYKTDGMIEQVMDTGTVTIELTGMKQEQIKLSGIENVENIVQYIQKVKQQHTTERQRRDAENQRIQEKMDEW